MDSYEKFLDRLADLPVKSPRTESGVEIELLKRLMTPEEAEMASFLTPIPEPASVVAKRADVSVETMRNVLDALAGKGVIFKIYTKEPLYSLASFLPGIMDFQVKRTTPEIAALWERYYKEKLGEGVLRNETPLVRVVPVKASISPEMTVFTYEEVDKIIDDARAIAVTDCVCRSAKKLIGEGCDAPVTDMCMFLDAYADYFAKNNIGRLISKEEAKRNVVKARDAGLVCNTANVRHGSIIICACCGCCCTMLRGITELAIPGAVAKSNFIAEIESDQCTGCGLCVEACHVDALVLEDDVAHLIEGRCIGCGVCTVVCQFDAITLKRRTEESLPPDNPVELMQRIASGRPDAEP